MRYTAVTALSHDGLLRDHNEDSLVVGPWTTCATTTLTPAMMAFPSGTPLTIAVADGLGGHPAGDLASTIVVQELARVGRHLVDEQTVRAALDVCNHAVYAAAERDPAATGMGTTVAGVVVGQDSIIVFNVGDSRVYAVRESGLAMASVDDSPPLAPGESHTVIVTQTLGGYPSPDDIDAHISTVPLGDHDRYLLCTDGLSDVVPESELGKVLADHKGPEAAVELWRAAIESGGPDNITLALVEMDTDEDDSG